MWSPIGSTRRTQTLSEFMGTPLDTSFSGCLGSLARIGWTVDASAHEARDTDKLKRDYFKSWYSGLRTRYRTFARNAETD